MTKHINYGQLNALCHIRGLSRRDSSNNQSAHNTFIKQYPKIFLQEKPRLPKIFKQKEQRIYSVKTEETKIPPDDSHNIAIYVQRARGGPCFYGQNGCLKKFSEFLAIVRKLPIRRTNHEHNIVWKMLSKIPYLKAQLSDEHLKMLSKNVFSETWVKGSTVIGNDGFYIILKGIAQACTRVFKSLADDNDPIMSSIPKESFVLDAELTDSKHAELYLPAQDSMMKRWSTFGSLGVMTDSDLDMIPFSIVTEEDCEILKIPAKEYTKLKMEKEKLENLQKFKLFRKCRYYEEWPTLSIKELIPISKWKKFPAGHVLIESGNIISFVGFINSGYCKIFRSIVGFVRLPLNKVKKVKKLVYMGKLKEKESFGEISVLLQVPFACTIIVGKEVEMAVIEDKDMFELDEVTKQLIIYSAKPTFDHLTDEDVKNEYIKMSQQREWNHYKDKAIKKSLFYNGIVPGFGKWDHYWTSIPRNLKNPLITY